MPLIIRLAVAVVLLKLHALVSIMSLLTQDIGDLQISVKILRNAQITEPVLEVLLTIQLGIVPRAIKASFVAIANQASKDQVLSSALAALIVL